MGAQTPTEKYGVMSPFHAGGGGGGGGGAGAATQVLDGGSNTVPHPHSTALLTPGVTIVANASGAKRGRADGCQAMKFAHHRRPPSNQSPTFLGRNPSPDRRLLTLELQCY